MSEDEKEPSGSDAAENESASEKEKAAAPEPTKPSSPWPSARKSSAPKAVDVAPAVPAAAAAAGERPKAAWGKPLDRFDRAWTKLDARLCAAVLIADAVTLVFWVSLKAMSATGTGGAGRVYRCLVTALVLGLATHFFTRKRSDKHEAITTGAVFVGIALGSRFG
ncbi:MAG: hypothetical protein JWP87_4503, partial [Labilithrix sp.]|nr:hypothetical protein [Labilithrix sp.]